MRYVDCNVDEFISRNQNRHLILFGIGRNAHCIEFGKLSSLRENFVYAIDNAPSQETIDFMGRNIQIKKPENIQKETGCSILITTSNYITEMYEQLNSMDLDDSLEIYIYPFMMLKEYHPLSEDQRNLLYPNEPVTLIPKMIHCFWFSGGKKPESYQRCIDTWKIKCPDYELREWNLNNYNYQKHPFIQRAIELHAWAFATDYARLDVMNTYGGIYMDMDVELVKPLDGLLCHNGVFPFCSDGGIELAMFLCRKKHPFLKQLLELYDNLKIPQERESFQKFYQPAFIMDTFAKNGVSMDDSFQSVDGNIFLPKHMMMPLDYCIYEIHTDADTIAIHRANAGWHEKDYTEKRINANKSLKTRLEQNESQC